MPGAPALLSSTHAILTNTRSETPPAARKVELHEPIASPHVTHKHQDKDPRFRHKKVLVQSCLFSPFRGGRGQSSPKMAAKPERTCHKLVKWAEHYSGPLLARPPLLQSHSMRVRRLLCCPAAHQMFGMVTMRPVFLVHGQIW